MSSMWYKDLVREVSYSLSSCHVRKPRCSSFRRQFRVLDGHELPAGFKCGVGFQTVSVCPSYYLPWITKELASRGVEVVRKKVASYGEAAALAGANGVLINATGLGASSGLHSTDCL